MSLNDVLSAIDAEIARVEQARALLAEVGTNKRGRKPATKRAKAKAKRTLSPEARKRIADAQRKRWAALRKAAK